MIVYQVAHLDLTANGESKAGCSELTRGASWAWRGSGAASAKHEHHGKPDPQALRINVKQIPLEAAGATPSNKGARDD